MRKKRAFIRIIVSPIILLLLIFTYTYGCIKQWLSFVRWGGEWITYVKNDAITIKDIYDQLNKEETK